MILEHFRSALRAQPFRPFVMHLADGRAIPVKHPELVVATSTGRTTVVVQPDDTLNIVDLLLVTELEYREPADAA
ncbi:MAG: hypothetical protein ACKOSQ_03810 [Planctomycetaceae bacterium]